ncbi:hypothetical protein [Romboutsia sp.]|uniref:hypothetical protein n=1 Tax=Romboutsia sp. TaxID=1965302 RepID=UPI003F2E4D23
MNKKTTSSQFCRYGSVYEEFREIDRENFISKNVITQLQQPLKDHIMGLWLQML